MEDGVVVRRGWRPPRRAQPQRLEPYLNHAPLAFGSILRGRFDLVHAFHTPHAASAAVWSRLTRRPLVVSLMGFPDSESIEAFRGRERSLRFAASRAAALHVLSEAAASALREATGLGATVIPPGTRVADFEIETQREELPTIFCAASAADRRKGVDELLQAFGLLRRQRPDAALVITGPVPPRLAAEAEKQGVRTMRPDVDQKELIRAYAGAWLTVLPSVREAFGQVLVESLAAGTPVAAVRSGAVAEIVDDPAVGVLCDERDPAELAAALAEGLELSERSGTREACRAHAGRWDWAVVGPRFEAMYREALGEKPESVKPGAP